MDERANWENLHRVLRAQGWVFHQQDGLEGLMSPSCAIFVGPEQLCAERRLAFFTSVERHLASLEELAAFDNDMKGARDDFHSLLSALRAQSSEAP
jgi:hypothetical protein